MEQDLFANTSIQHFILGYSTTHRNRQPNFFCELSLSRPAPILKIIDYRGACFYFWPRRSALRFKLRLWTIEPKLWKRPSIIALGPLLSTWYFSTQSISKPLTPFWGHEARLFSSPVRRQFKSTLQPLVLCKISSKQIEDFNGSSVWLVVTQVALLDLSLGGQYGIHVCPSNTLSIPEAASIIQKKAVTWCWGEPMRLRICLSDKHGTNIVSTAVTWDLVRAPSDSNSFWLLLPIFLHFKYTTILGARRLPSPSYLE
jgi:hypothetical protein